MRIVVATGSSGGHVYPAMAFIRAVQARDKGCRVLLVIPERGVRYVGDPGGAEVLSLPFSPISARPCAANAAALFRLAVYSARCLESLLVFKPDVVVGFGSLSSVPVVAAAWLLRTKTLIHEQNVIPGRANRFLAPLADRVAVSFKETSLAGRKQFVSGNPLRLARQDRKKALDFFGFSPDRKTVLVCGGSQGSERINRQFLAALEGAAWRGRLQVIHCCGEKDADWLKQRYAALSCTARVFPFLEEMALAYSCSDLVISRAGAGTVSELALFRVPAVLVPYPFAYSHQSANAGVLEKDGCCRVIKDSELDARLLRQFLQDALENPALLERMAAGYGSLPPIDPARVLAEEALSLGGARHYHLIGIGGIGMSGIARLLFDKGAFVSGSDLKESRATVELAKAGCKVSIGHDAANIAGADEVIFSSAVKSDNPEYAAAARAGIPLTKRGLALAGLMREKKVITVTGAHGKTTTSSLVSHLMLEAGLSPTIAVGGIFKNIGNNVKPGEGEYFVAEADESDGSFLYYRPRYSIITNIDREHLDYYRDFSVLLGAFRSFIAQTAKGGCVFCCGDDANLVRLLQGHRGRSVLFGLTRACDVRPSNIAMRELNSEFECLYFNKPIGRFRLALGGMHNISNAMAVIALAMELGVSLEVTGKALATYKGTGRRLEVKFRDGRTMLVDDYAHHPTEIRATLAALEAVPHKRLIAVFQPHRYTRTRLLLDEFGKSFASADRVIITDIYAASEKPIPGIDAGIVCGEIRRNEPAKQVEYIEKDRILERLTATLEPGDLIVTLGAGDITRISDELAEKLAKKV